MVKMLLIVGIMVSTLANGISAAVYNERIKEYQERDEDYKRMIIELEGQKLKMNERLHTEIKKLQIQVSKIKKVPVF